VGDMDSSVTPAASLTDRRRIVDQQTDELLMSLLPYERQWRKARKISKMLFAINRSITKFVNKYTGAVPRGSGWGRAAAPSEISAPSFAPPPKKKSSR